MPILRILCLLLSCGSLAARVIPELSEVIVRPKAAPGPLDNPLKGYCVYTDAGKIHRPYSMVFLYAPWKELEPAEGRYAFAAWEKGAWGHPAAADEPAVLRVYADHPKNPLPMPEWLQKKCVT